MFEPVDILELDKPNLRRLFNNLCCAIVLHGNVRGSNEQNKKEVFSVEAKLQKKVGRRRSTEVSPGLSKLVAISHLGFDLCQFVAWHRCSRSLTPAGRTMHTCKRRAYSHMHPTRASIKLSSLLYNLFFSLYLPFPPHLTPLNRLHPTPPPPFHLTQGPMD